jgi:formimidoylglutamate deiminase
LSALSSRNEGSGVATTFVPDLLYTGGRFERDVGLACDGGGRVLALLPLDDLRELLGGEIPEGEVLNVALPGPGIIFATRFVRLRGRALLPGMVNAHSHAFQRVIRGRTEYRGAHAADSFWTWREEMYEAASRLTPEDIYDASRMAFLEMILAGITSVGEFHYLHRTPEGEEYEDPNLLAKQVVRAARDTGLRIALLRVAYERAGFQSTPDERQRRFIEPDPETFIRNTDALARDVAALESTRGEAFDVKASGDEPPHGARSDGGLAGSRPPSGSRPASAWVGVAPHSVRAVSAGYLSDVNAFANTRSLVVHMHVAEQPAEVEACREETGRTPVALLADEGVLGPNFTAVHAVHVTPEEVQTLARAGSRVCACPTTERNLGDGVVPADLFFGAGVPVALGTDSHAQIDLLEDARELEYHLRLKTLRRNVLAPSQKESTRDADARGEQARDEGRAAVGDEEARAASVETGASALAARLFECATAAGARSIGAHSGEFEPGSAADFFAVDLEDPSVVGASAEDLLPSVVFSLSRAGIREVFVGGRPVVEEGRHAAQREIVSRFAALQKRLWSRGRD